VVKLRLKRFGRRNRPFYRLNATDQRNARDGRVIEQLGFYDPIEKDAEKAFKVDDDRVKHWLSVGAQPSETVARLLVKNGFEIALPERVTKPSKAELAAKEAEEAAAKEAAEKAAAEAEKAESEGGAEEATEEEKAAE